MLYIYFKGSNDLIIGDAPCSDISVIQGGSTAVQYPLILVPNQITEVPENEKVLKSKESGVLNKLEKRGLIEFVSKDFSISDSDETTTTCIPTSPVTTIKPQIQSGPYIITSQSPAIIPDGNNVTIQPQLDAITKLLAIQGEAITKLLSEKAQQNNKVSLVKRRGRPKGSKNKQKA